MFQGVAWMFLWLIQGCFEAVSKGVSSDASLLFQRCFKAFQKVFHKEFYTVVGEFSRYFKKISRMFPGCFRWN